MPLRYWQREMGPPPSDRKSDRQRTLAILAELGTQEGRVLEEGRERGEPMPTFPRAFSDTEYYTKYRYTQLPPMKYWAMWALRQLPEISEDDFEVHAAIEAQAIAILDRPLKQPEKLLLAEVLGNMLTVIGIHRQLRRAQEQTLRNGSLRR